MREQEEESAGPVGGCGDPDCTYCVLDRHDFCKALDAFYRSAGPAEERETWEDLRTLCIPTAATARTFHGKPGRAGMTVWLAVCRSEGITDHRGGRFCVGGDIPTPDEVRIAILYSEVSRPKPGAARGGAP